MNSLKGRRGRLPSRSHLVQLGNQEIPHVNIAPELVKAHIERVTESSQMVGEERNNSSHLTSLEVIKQFYVILGQMFQSFQNWSHRIPSFQDLPREDQNILFTSAFLELFAFDIAKTLNSKDDFVSLGNGISIGITRLPESFKSWLDSIYNLSTALARLSLDTTCMACIEALILVTERCGLKEPEKIGSLQSKICESLQYHIENTYDGSCKNSPVLSHILGKLPQLRTISYESVQLMKRLEANQVKSPCFVKELYLSDQHI